MANYQILGSQITASSEFHSSHGAANARLNGTTIPQVWVAAWIASPGEANPWLQVDFIDNATVSEISTQGRDNADQWVKTYSVRYSLDGTIFREYEENGVFKVDIRPALCLIYSNE